MTAETTPDRDPRSRREEPDRNQAANDMLRRLERRALVLTGLGVTAAFVVPGGGLRMAVGVLGGALIAGTSYWAIKRGVTGLGAAVLTSGARPRSARGAILAVGRYALLGGMAYVMIARLRLHPIALLGGASVIPLAAALEAVRVRQRP